MRPTTPEEAKAIRALKRLAKNWPSSLWLFAASGDLCVMRLAPGQGMGSTPTGGMDPAYVLDSIAIPCDGGDW